MDNEEDVFNKAISAIGGKNTRESLEKTQQFSDSVMGVDTSGKVAEDINSRSLEQMKEQRSLPRLQIKDYPYSIGYEKLLHIIKNFEETGCSPNFKYFIIASYLFGGRVSETNKLTRSSITSRIMHGEPYLVARMITLKRKDGQDRTVVCPKNSFEHEMVEIFEKEFLSHFYGNEILFNLDRRYAWHQCHKIDIGPILVKRQNPTNRKWSTPIRQHFNAYPHYFRHMRLTSLAIDYNYSDASLREFTNWKSTAMAATYTALNASDQALKMNAVMSSIRNLK